MLEAAGIDFDALKHQGIEHLILAEYLISSGLLLNDEVKWITYHGAFDYAYLLKMLLNDRLPQDYQGFSDVMNDYFPYTIDTKIVAMEAQEIKGSSLQKLGNEFGVNL